MLCEKRELYKVLLLGLLKMENDFSFRKRTLSIRRGSCKAFYHHFAFLRFLAIGVGTVAYSPSSLICSQGLGKMPASPWHGAILVPFLCHNLLVRAVTFGI